MWCQVAYGKIYWESSFISRILRRLSLEFQEMLPMGICHGCCLLQKTINRKQEDVLPSFSVSHQCLLLIKLKIMSSGNEEVFQLCKQNSEVIKMRGYRLITDTLGNRLT
jgi:hypothetical protein